jgi:hypothetical protein
VVVGWFPSNYVTSVKESMDLLTKENEKAAEESKSDPPKNEGGKSKISIDTSISGSKGMHRAKNHARLVP